MRAFEAAARHLSFTRAAEELNVTQGAISHQVKVLESWLGVPLFQRNKREIKLTEEGVVYLPGVRATLNKLHTVTQQIVEGDSTHLLNIATPESFAVNWLISRLRSFHEEHPDIDVRLTTQNQIDDFGNLVGEEGPAWVDMRIRCGRGRWTGLQVIKILDEEMFPVCSPELMDGEKGLSQLENLQFHTLLHDDMQIPWRNWLLKAGLDELDTNRGPHFSHSHMVLKAAVEGQGVALGRSVLVADDLASGKLVKPFDINIPADHAYYLVYPEITVDQPKINAFQDWLIKESSRFKKLNTD
ncbi:MAG: transcriptional regulator GcvA [Gammaproteobacteria bacterium]|nr:transcriptional regulator GcvA [Gammaproteobacteria bacterium]